MGLLLSMAPNACNALDVGDAISLYNVYQAEGEWGSHGFTVTFDQYSWEKTWTYGGRPQFVKRYAARDALGKIDYTTITPSGTAKAKFTICTSDACDVPHEVRDYSCQISRGATYDKRSFGNSDGDERLKSRLQYLVSHKYEINPSKNNREHFEQYGVWSVLEAPAETASTFCWSFIPPNSFSVQVPFVIFPNTQKKPVLFVTTQSRNFAITSSSGIFGKLDPAVFK